MAEAATDHKRVVRMSANSFNFIGWLSRGCYTRKKCPAAMLLLWVYKGTGIKLDIKNQIGFYLIFVFGCVAQYQEVVQ